MTATDDKKKSSGLKILVTILRWGLCAAAIVYLVMSVKWNDTINIGTDDAPRLVRLVEKESDDGPFVVMQNDQRTTVQLDEVNKVNGLPDIRYGISGVVANLDRWGAVIALLAFAPVPILSAIRLIWMLAMQAVQLSLWVAVKLTYAGNFFNFALPGTTGGDLIKAYYLTRYTHRKTEAVTTVFLDRVIGLLGLVLLAGCMIIVAWDRERFGRIAMGLGVILAGLAVGAIFVFSKRLRHALGLPKLAEKLPAGQHILRIGRTLIALRDNKGKSLAALVITLVLQFLVMLSVYLMSQAMQMQGDFQHYFVFLPILFLVGALPLAPQGAGVMEFFAVQFFGTELGNSVSQAFALALSIRLIQLFWALPGVLVPLFGAHLPSSAELHELEEVDEPEPAPEDHPAHADVVLSPALSSRD
ncbi:MAG: lysylphosphatidylglycerol synthase transmembrane domain-containing protein [Phycisphaerae bacterium]